MSVPRKINQVIIHCSDSTFGDVPQIRSWHTMPPPHGRGFSDIGYHWVVLNGQITPKVPYQTGMDGVIQAGRPENVVGAHCEGHNAHSLGVCLVGIDKFTGNQMEKLLVFLLHYCAVKGLEASDVIGHYETDTGKAQGKTCPNFDMVPFRKELAARIERERQAKSGAPSKTA
jgi:hypothetical protein